MRSDEFYRSAVADLFALGPQHVWSLLVTVFGDLAQSPEMAIDGPVLTALMAEMGIKPEATRVALHRLRSEGWIVSQKCGRTSSHALSKKALSESHAASPRIYGRAPGPQDGWQLVITETSSDALGHDMRRLGFMPLMPRVFIGAAAARPPEHSLVLHPDTVPDWLGQQLEPKELSQEYDALHETLLGIASRMPNDLSLSPSQVAALRCLLVHAWRRLVLRHPDLPIQVYSATWKGPACRKLVLDLLDRLPRPALGALSDAA